MCVSKTGLERSNVIFKNCVQKVFIMYAFRFTILPIKEEYGVCQVEELPFCAFLPNKMTHLLYIKCVKVP